jgi:hypothetical protein
MTASTVTGATMEELLEAVFRTEAEESMVFLA